MWKSKIWGSHSGTWGSHSGIWGSHSGRKRSWAGEGRRNASHVQQKGILSCWGPRKDEWPLETLLCGADEKVGAMAHGGAAIPDWPCPWDQGSADGSGPARGWRRECCCHSFASSIAEGRIQNLALRATPKKLLVGETLHLECKAETFINGRIEFIWTCPRGRVSGWNSCIPPFPKSTGLRKPNCYLFWNYPTICKPVIDWTLCLEESKTSLPSLNLQIKLQTSG